MRVCVSNDIDINVTTGETYDDYPSITFTLKLRRKPLYYVVNLILPCCLLSFVAVATFILQPGCYDRLALGKSAECGCFLACCLGMGLGVADFKSVSK